MPMFQRMPDIDLGPNDYRPRPSRREPFFPPGGKLRLVLVLLGFFGLIGLGMLRRHIGEFPNWALVIIPICLLAAYLIDRRQRRR